MVSWEIIKLGTFSRTALGRFGELWKPEEKRKPSATQCQRKIAPPAAIGRTRLTLPMPTKHAHLLRAGPLLL